MASIENVEAVSSSEYPEAAETQLPETEVVDEVESDTGSQVSAESEVGVEQGAAKLSAHPSLVAIRADAEIAVAEKVLLEAYWSGAVAPHTNEFSKVSYQKAAYLAMCDIRAGLARAPRMPTSGLSGVALAQCATLSQAGLGKIVEGEVTRFRAAFYSANSAELLDLAPYVQMAGSAGTQTIACAVLYVDLAEKFAGHLRTQQESKERAEALDAIFGPAIVQALKIVGPMPIGGQAHKLHAAISRAFRAAGSRVDLFRGPSERHVGPRSNAQTERGQVGHVGQTRGVDQSHMVRPVRSGFVPYGGQYDNPQSVQPCGAPQYGMAYGASRGGRGGRGGSRGGRGGRGGY